MVIRRGTDDPTSSIHAVRTIDAALRPGQWQIDRPALTVLVALALDGCAVAYAVANLLLDFGCVAGVESGGAVDDAVHVAADRVVGVHRTRLGYGASDYHPVHGDHSRAVLG
jgi:hypothetical protein